jgi:uncharacterized flavoprotein (TIGR03862 family)
MPSAGRKFLVAGRGGLNLTNTAPDSEAKYSGPDFPQALWQQLLSDFGPEDLRQWAEGLGVKTFAAPSGRVYPEEMKSAPLLRRWIAGLKSKGVCFFHRHRWTGLGESSAPGVHRLQFQTPSGRCEREASAVVFALGGASWPITGSDGSWQSIFQSLGVGLNPLVPANCGWEVPWPEEVLAEAEGLPLKNVCGSVGTHQAYGELLITSYGLEGGVLYTLTPALRSSHILYLDLKPAFPLADLVSRMPRQGGLHLQEAFERCRIKGPSRVIMRTHVDCPQWRTPQDFANAVKALPIRLSGPRPIGEAISSAGGVIWGELNEDLMLRRLPGIFLAGEMLDWEAPTGGYLLQGCFSTGTRAGAGASRFLHL